MGDALSTNPSYADLFTEAFGDGEVTAERIAFAIATYQRTLISDQSTWDEFRTTDPLAMTPLEQQGWQLFRMRNCNACHIDPLFSGNGFHNIGLRPAEEDRGRAAITGNFFEEGAFRTPTLRNVALRPRYMHNGMHETLEEVMRHYGNFDGQQFTENLDPLMNVINLQESDVAPLVAFMGALTDPRVEQGLFPFDAPTLRSQMGPNPALIAGAAPGAMGINPVIIANNPPLLGFEDFRIGLGNVPAGITATLVVTDTPPSGGTLIDTQVVTQVTTDGDLLVNGAGFATAFWPVPSDGALDGEVPLHAVGSSTTRTRPAGSRGPTSRSSRCSAATATARRPAWVTSTTTARSISSTSSASSPYGTPAPSTPTSTATAQSTSSTWSLHHHLEHRLPVSGSGAQQSAKILNAKVSEVCEGREGEACWWWFCTRTEQAWMIQT